MSGTPVAAAVLAGAEEATRVYLRMPAGADAAVLAQAAAAACATCQAFLGADLPADWADVPGPVAQGIVLLAAQIIEHREAGVSPAAAALLRPFRVVRLSREVAT